MLFVLNSSDRQMGTGTNFFYTLKTPILRVCKIKLRSIIFPNVIYNCTASNNVINWTRGSTFNYIIPPGYYDIPNLLSTIQSGMNNLDANNYALTFSNTSLLVTITGSAAFSINFGVPNSCYALLGFPNTTTASSTSQTGTYAPNLISPTSIYITIGELGATARANEFRFTFHVPLVNQNSTLLFLDHQQLGEQTLTSPFPVDLYRFSVIVTDQYGNNLNLLGLDFTMVLEIEI
jgi:hypothetical protein